MRAFVSRTAVRTRWSAFGAVVAVLAGGGGLLAASAAGGADGASAFTAIAPCRILDTRATSTVGPRNTPLGPGETHSISTFGVNGNCNLPSAFTALALNVTAVNPTASSYITVFPADHAVPTASNLNVVAGQAPVPNAVTVAVAGDGHISFYNNGGQVDVVADVVGYYAGHNHDDRYYTKDQTYSRDEVFRKDQVYAREETVTRNEVYTRGQTYSKSESVSKVEAEATLDQVNVDISKKRLAYDEYAAAAYRLTAAGCATGSARFVPALEWGVPGTFPDLPCFTLPVWNDANEFIAWSAQQEKLASAPIVGLPPEVRWIDPGDDLIDINRPVVQPPNATSGLLGCAIATSPALSVNCGFFYNTAPFPNAFPYDGAQVLAAAEGQTVAPLGLLQLAPPNP